MRRATAIMAGTLAILLGRSIAAEPLAAISYDTVVARLRVAGLGPTNDFRMSAKPDCARLTGSVVASCSIRFTDSARAGRGAKLSLLFFKPGYDFATVVQTIRDRVGDGNNNRQRKIRYTPTMTLTVHGRSSSVPIECYESYGSFNSIMSCVLPVATNAAVVADVNPGRNSSTEQSVDREAHDDERHAASLLELGVSVFTAIAEQSLPRNRPAPTERVLDPNDIWKVPGPVPQRGRARGIIGSSATFNLICSGILVNNGNSKPNNTTYRVDLTRMKYCVGNCLATFPIASVQPSKIIFENSDKGGNRNLRTVDRRSGAWVDYTDANIGFRFQASTTGTCAEAPFSGLPVR